MSQSCSSLQIHPSRTNKKPKKMSLAEFMQYIEKQELSYDNVIINPVIFSIPIHALNDIIIQVKELKYMLKLYLEKTQLPIAKQAIYEFCKTLNKFSLDMSMEMDRNIVEIVHQHALGAQKSTRKLNLTVLAWLTTEQVRGPILMVALLLGIKVKIIPNPNKKNPLGFFLIGNINPFYHLTAFERGAPSYVLPLSLEQMGEILFKA